MSLISGNIKEILSIKLKQRHDSITDQFNRILMVKMLVIFSIVTSMEFFSDKVTCMFIMTQDTYMTEEFVHSACWIRGFYVYEELVNRTTESSYYGIPRDVEIDGVDDNKELCRRVNQRTRQRNHACRPLTKKYFVQYQYFPFYVASLAIFFYIPYLFFRVVNRDMINLKAAVKDASGDQAATNIINMYFNYKSNGGKFILRIKVCLTIAIKLLYVIVSVCSFMFTDHLLGYKYVNYGVDWLRWSRKSHIRGYDHRRARGVPRPGDILLPSMGFCDITEGVVSRTKVSFNDHKIICEISTHIIYQYVLFVLWFLFVCSIILSFIGFFYYIWRSVYAAIFGHLCKSSNSSRKQAYLYQFTVREIEYMELIRVKHMVLYKDILARCAGETIVKSSKRSPDSETQTIFVGAPTNLSFPPTNISPTNPSFSTNPRFPPTLI